MIPSNTILESIKGFFFAKTVETMKTGAEMLIVCIGIQTGKLEEF